MIRIFVNKTQITVVRFKKHFTDEILRCISFRSERQQVRSVLAIGRGGFGVITTLVGLPILISGSSKTNKVKNATRSHELRNFNIGPGFVYANNNQNLYPGATLRFSF